MSDTQIVYRWVRFDSTHMYSVFSAQPTMIPVCYKINQWVEPTIKGSKLFCFDTLEHARMLFPGMTKNDPCIQLYKCEAIGVSKPTYICDIFHSINNFWKIKRKKKKVPESYKVSPSNIGMLWCDKIKLIKRIEL